MFGTMIYKRESKPMSRSTEDRDLIETQETIKMIAEVVFRDYRENGFDQGLAIGYNILISASNYLKTGSPMIGERCIKFFEEVN